MGKLKAYYKDMSLKKALIITIAFSLMAAFCLALLIAAVTRPGYNKLLNSNADEIEIQLHDFFTILSIGICVCIVIIIGVFIFYRQKLSVPLQVLKDGIEQIAMDNLDFAVRYEARDELGTLCQAFDRMRGELLHNYKKIWRLTEERKKLNASFAHDLRTPLTVLKGYTDFLEEYIPSNEKKDEKLLATNRMMAQYIKRLEEYVEIMNTIQKLEDTPIKVEPVSTADFIEMLKGVVKTSALEYRKESSITNEISLKMIHGDVSLIFRVLENVLMNAFQYSKSKVSVRLLDYENLLHIEIDDDGPGFREKDLDEALNPFYTSRENDSFHFGLGLNICKTLCENHGGSISINNTKDSGAKVIITFLLEK